MSDVFTLQHGQFKDTSCQIRQFGATVTSWKVDGVENIFVSDKAVLDGSKAIRGGVPVCFPQFGPWELGPQHGFARSSDKWTVTDGPSVDEKNGEAKITLTLCDDESTLKAWPKRFRFHYTVTLTPRSLDLSMDVSNQGDDSLDFTFCLHTYFRVPDVTRCEVSGLKGLTYVDKTDGAKEKVEEEDVVRVDGFVDRVYKRSPDECVLTGLQGGRRIKLSKTNMADTVVWNPWIEGAKKMGDFGDDEYKEMICVEAVQFSDRVELDPGKEWTAEHKLQVLD